MQISKRFKYFRLKISSMYYILFFIFIYWLTLYKYPFHVRQNINPLQPRRGSVLTHYLTAYSLNLLSTLYLYSGKIYSTCSMFCCLVIGPSNNQNFIIIYDSRISSSNHYRYYCKSGHLYMSYRIKMTMSDRIA